jgi:hypothetical protein
VQGQEPQSVKSKGEKLAYSAYVLGVASTFCGITAIPAIIQSIRALIRIHKDGAGRMAKRQAVFGLIYPVCVVLLILALFLPALLAAQAHVDGMVCINHLKNLALQMKVYADDHGEQLPGQQWCDFILTNRSGSDLREKGADLLRCPAAPKKQRCGYAFNRKLIGVPDITAIAPDTVMLFDSDTGWNALGGPEIAALHHDGRLNVVMVDLSARQVGLDELKTLRWDPSTNKPAK